MGKAKANLSMESSVDTLPLGRYPRPELVRDSFISLNGQWEGGVMVPYPLQSKNSHYKREHVPEEYTYKRSFTLPSDFIRDRVILHFGAVDQIAEVYIDGKFVGKNEGGYIPFSYDITSFVEPGKEHKLRVRVVDRLSHHYPYGKQRKRRGGMWYTPITGIWQSVWIESVWKDYVKKIKITPDLKGITLEVDSTAAYCDVKIYYPSGAKDQKLVKEFTLSKYMDTESGELKRHITIDNPKLWSPEEPNLYDITIRAFDALDGATYDDIVREGFNGNQKYDLVKSYFGLRTVSVEKVGEKNRLMLNGKPYFFHGVLDQGYFPEGIYTPNTEQDYFDDVRRMKELGFNTIRKHIKVEPSAFYEACDRIGMIVWQDMVNNGKYSFIRDTALANLGKQKKNDTHRPITLKTKQMFTKTFDQTIERLYNFPCVCYYTIFNEGWGQFNSDKFYERLKEKDDTRIVDSTSGWFWQDLSDVDSFHVYYHPVVFDESERPVVVSEFGGYSLVELGHMLDDKVSYGYSNMKDEVELMSKIEMLYLNEVIAEIPRGLCGTIYTQAYDVEDESNGLYTYDRKVCKVDKELMQNIARKLKEVYKF